LTGQHRKDDRDERRLLQARTIAAVVEALAVVLRELLGR
jgi:hypothetical protein